jgi:hypothetical protein
MTAQSPLFPVIAPNVASSHALRVTSSTTTGVSAGPVLAITVMKARPSDAVILDSIEEAEDKTLALAKELEIPLSNQRDRTAGQIFMSRLIQAGSMIAKSTRRGAGNLTFMHPNSLALLYPEKLVEEDLGWCGRWRQYKGIGNFIHNVSDHIPMHMAYVAYVNNSALGDGPATVACSGSDIAWFPLKPGTGLLGDASDYLRYVEVASFLTPRQLGQSGITYHAEVVDKNGRPRLYNKL